MNAHKKVVCLDAQTQPSNQVPAIENLDDLLEQNGFEIVHTPQEEMGLNAVCRETPDVVLLDISSSRNSIWDLYHQIRNSTQTCNIPVILISQKTARIEDVLKLYAANAADCLMKPFAPQDLLSSLNQVLLN
jgi:DNA-binding response OmpR family regulator